jgi:UDP-glucuronate 4-epimerase
MKILVTGAAGFIGFFVSKKLLDLGYKITGIDNLNDYYDVELKNNRLKNIDSDNFNFFNIDLVDEPSLNSIFLNKKFDCVINLAAQAGVRYSLENPHTYINSNIVGFSNILEACRHNNVKHLIYASSSSVYGMNKSVPFSVKDNVDHPASLYAATKKSNELLAHSYSHLYNIPTTGLRFFTVYGPWGRPDMAYFLFTKAILEGNPIKVFNKGDMKRDFTYIDDIVFGITSLLDKPAKSDKNLNSPSNPSVSSAPYALYNIGNNNPVELGKFIETIEDILGVEAKKEYYEMQPGDMKETFADIDELSNLTGYKPITSLRDGLQNFIDWYKDYYSI